MNQQTHAQTDAQTHLQTQNPAQTRARTGAARRADPLRRLRPHPLAGAAALACSLVATAPAQAATFTWTSGSFTPGVTAPSPLPEGDLLQITGAASKNFTAVNFQNLGTVDWDGGTLIVGNGAQVSNAGLWNLAGNLSLSFGGGLVADFINTGVLRRTAGDGAAVFSNSSALAFTNSGQVDVLSGTLRFNGSNSFLAGSSFTGSGLAEVFGASTFSGAVQSQNLRLVAGTQTGDLAQLQGTVGWVGGSLNGTWAVQAGASLVATEAGTRALTGAATVLDNQGQLLWNTSATLTLGSGATLVNSGTLDMLQSASFVFGGGTSSTLVNDGTLRHSGAGTGTVGNSNAFALVNSGTLEAASGVLRLQGASTFNDGSVFSGPGVVEVLSDSQFNGSFQSDSLQLLAGTQTGQEASVGGQLAWQGGSLQGTWTVQAGAEVRASAAGTKILTGEDTVFTNNGSLVWDTSATLAISSGATLVNAGLLDMQQSASFVFGGGSPGTLVNSGTLRHSGTTTGTVGNSPAFVLVNNGTLQASSGVLRLQGASTFNDGSVFSGAGVVEVLTNSQFNGSFQSANLRLAAGTQTGEAARLGGQVNWTGGTFAGDWSVEDGATLEATGAGSRSLTGTGTVMNNAGTLQWNTTGTLIIGSGASLVNTGLLDLQQSASFVYGGGAAVQLLNQGELRVSNSASALVGNSTAFELVNQGLIDVRAGSQLTLPPGFGNDGTISGDGTVAVGTPGLNNRGTIAPGSFGVGTLALTGNLLQTGDGVFAVDLGQLDSFDLLNVSGTASLAGTLALSCLGDCSFAVGDSFTILQASGTLDGSFAEVSLSGFATGAFDVLYDSSNFQVRLLVTEAVTPVPEPGTWALWFTGLAALGFVSRRRRHT